LRPITRSDGVVGDNAGHATKKHSHLCLLLQQLIEDLGATCERRITAYMRMLHGKCRRVARPGVRPRLLTHSGLSIQSGAALTHGSAALICDAGNASRNALGTLQERLQLTLDAC
jgi:hypothetical protein